MEKFTELHGIAAPLAVPNINTDVLIRIERLNELPKDQLGPYCFEAWRYDAQAPENLAYYGTPIGLKIEYGVFYLGLAAFLGIMTQSVHGMLEAGRGGGF